MADPPPTEANEATMAAPTSNDATSSIGSNPNITANPDRRRNGRKQQKIGNKPIQAWSQMSLLHAKEMARNIRSMTSNATCYAITLSLIASRTARGWIVGTGNYVLGTANSIVDRLFLLRESYDSPYARLMASTIAMMVEIMKLPLFITLLILEVTNLALLNGAEWALEYINSTTADQETKVDENKNSQHMMLPKPSHHNDDDKNRNVSARTKIRLIPSQCIGRRPNINTQSPIHSKLYRVETRISKEDDPPRLIEDGAGAEPSEIINDGNKDGYSNPNNSMIVIAHPPTAPRMKVHSTDVHVPLIQEPIAHCTRSHQCRAMTHNKSTADRARSKEDGKTEEQISEKPLTATFKNNNTKLQREIDAAMFIISKLQRDNNAAKIAIYDEHEGDKSPTITKTTNSQPNENGVDLVKSQRNDWNRIQHRLETCRERWKAQRKRPHNNIIPKECNTIQANVECTQSKTINKTSLRYIEVHLNNLKGKLIHGRQIFIHIFGTNRIEPKRNVIKWQASNLSIC